MKVEVTAKTYSIDKYHGMTERSYLDDTFQIERRHIFDSWKIVAGSFGIGYEIGDMFDHFPIKLDQEYWVNGCTHVSTRRIHS